MRAAPNTPFWVVTGGRTFALAPGEYLIGRGPDCHICFPSDTMLSRRHARLVVSMSQVEVEDLGSSNGTWIGSTLVQHRMYFRERQILKVGKQELTLRRSHTARDRHSSVTCPELEVVAPEQIWSDGNGFSEIPTFDGSPVELIQSDANAMLDAGQTDEARKLVEPVLALLDRAAKDLSSGELEQISLLALRLAVSSGQRQFVDWVLAQHTRQVALMSESTAASLLAVLQGDLKVDETKVRHYLSTLRPAEPNMSDEELKRCARLETMLTRHD